MAIRNCYTNLVPHRHVDRSEVRLTLEGRIRLDMIGTDESRLLPAYIQYL